MKSMLKNAISTMMERRSVRTFSGRALEAEHRLALQKLLAAEERPLPFGTTPRFRLEDTAEGGFEDRAGRIGTYGTIKGEAGFVVGACQGGAPALADFGYAFEGIVLGAEELGIGSCWLAGTFSRSAVAKRLGLAEGELVPAVSPVGYAAERPNFRERASRFVAGSDGRKPWELIFFDGEVGRLLDRNAAGLWAQALDAVRRGPSAMNKQPWRILREGEGRFLLLLDEDRRYNSLLPFPIQALDLGIAMRHFQEAATALGLSGAWIPLADAGKDPAAGAKGGAGTRYGALKPFARWE